MKKRKCLFIIVGMILLALAVPGEALAQPEFTDEERAYIDGHGEIYVAGNPDFAPAEYYNNGDYEGIIPEIFRKVSEKSGLKFTYINGIEKPDSYAQNKQAEIISGLSEEHLKKLSLSDSMVVMLSPQDHSQQIYIGFTGIAGSELKSIIEKSLEDFDDYDTQDVILSGTNDASWRGISRQTKLMLIILGLAVFLSMLAALLLQYQNNGLINRDAMTGEESYEHLKKRFGKRFTSARSKFNYYVVNFKLETEEIVRLYGYDEIGSVMKYLTDVLKRNTTQEEGFARLYDDTIVMVGMVSSQSIVESRITNLMDTMTKHLMEVGRHYELEINAGLYYLQGINDTFEQCVDYAMQARVRASERRRRLGICTEEMLDEIGKENRMEKEVLSALYNKEFISYIQPIMNTQTGEIDSGQMLARWDSKRYGLVRPDLFLKILEKHNLLDDLDFLMYENTVAFLAEMNRRRQPMLTMFVSFSKDAVEKEDFYERILDVVDNYNVSARYIGVIINKDNMDMEVKSLNSSIAKLKESGITVLLDDFDQSPYALRNVNSLSVDYVKISRDMLVGLVDESAQKILEGLINTLHEVGVRVICKDFTDEDNLPILRRIGCDGVQGNKYFFPMPTEEFLKMER